MGTIDTIKKYLDRDRIIIWTVVTLFIATAILENLNYVSHVQGQVIFLSISVLYFIYALYAIIERRTKNKAPTSLLYFLFLLAVTGSIAYYTAQIINPSSIDATVLEQISYNFVIVSSILIAAITIWKRPHRYILEHTVFAAAIIILISFASLIFLALGPTGVTSIFDTPIAQLTFVITQFILSIIVFSIVFSKLGDREQE
ncbi:MAG: hypothetical protein KGH65_03040 [Candidatus Micrarchaeota archaeon]|nr:hypothetical protein [Candidatus Micrarchaeota archaeon]